MTLILQPTRHFSFTQAAWLLVLLFALCLPRQASAHDFSTVVIDPGHGGNDKGSNWYGVYEKNLTLDLSKRIQRILKKERHSVCAHPQYGHLCFA